MFNKPAKFEKQLSRGAMTVSNGVSKTVSPTGVISKSMVEEVHSVNDEERQKVDIEELNQIMCGDVFLELLCVFL
jgi:hypothetical protein